MAKRRFFTVGFTAPSDNFEYVDSSSKQTLLDTDIALFQPYLTFGYSTTSYAGKSVMDEHASFSVHQELLHWRSEILAAASAGKLVVVYLNAPIEGYRYTGQKSYSGTGRSRVTQPLVAPISSYDAIPHVRDVTAKQGTSIVLEKDTNYLAGYWQEFGGCSPYQVEMSGEFSQPMLKSKSGGRLVGARVTTPSGGNILFLPALQFDETFTETKTNRAGEVKEYWTKSALQFGERLAQALSSLADALKQARQVTPPPAWTNESTFRLEKEALVEAEIADVSETISKLSAKKIDLEADLLAAGELRNLLYEQGYPLERAILQALNLLGFSAAPYRDAESEFDAVFTSPEGRCLGEAEGKDSKAVNIDKLAQLERNIQEDFARDDVTSHAKGVLFGNAFRLKPLSERSECFTEKCISGAKRAGFALVRTSDLFAPAKYLLSCPDDATYARTCREVIFATGGTIVTFPPPPEDSPSRGLQESGVNSISIPDEI